MLNFTDRQPYVTGLTFELGVVRSLYVCEVLLLTVLELNCVSGAPLPLHLVFHHEKSSRGCEGSRQFRSATSWTGMCYGIHPVVWTLIIYL